MCLAIVQRPGTEVDDSVLLTADFNNPDGFGYAFVRNGNVVVRRGPKFWDLEKQYRKEHGRYGEQSTFLVHFRLATCGNVCLANSHPYPLKNGGALIHNGVLDLAGIPKGFSDTRWLVKSVLNKLPENWPFETNFVGMVKDFIGVGNKLGILMPNGGYTIIGEKSGYWQDEIWYSNESGEKVYTPYQGWNKYQSRADQLRKAWSRPGGTQILDKFGNGAGSEDYFDEDAWLDPGRYKYKGGLYVPFGDRFETEEEEKAIDEFVEAFGKNMGLEVV